jgi:outer membrane protein OmpA-like peptidoglycan-associated protein
MKRMSLFLILVSAFISASFAQEDLTLAEAVTRTTKSDNWFVQGGLNLNLLHGEQDKLVNPFKRIKLGGELAVGKWFNAYFGTRLQGNFGGLRGFNYCHYNGDGDGRYGSGYMRPDDGIRTSYPMGVDRYGLIDVWPGGGNYNIQPPAPFTPVHSNAEGWGFWQDFNYSTITIDLLSNFSSLFYGRYNDRTVNLIPLIGVGLINAYDNNLTTPSWYYSVLKIGGNMDIRLTHSLSLYLEAKAFITNPEFDGYKGTAMLEALTNLTLGLSYTFNKGHANLGQLTLDEIDNLNDRVNENRELIENHQEILERQQDLLDKLRKGGDRPVSVVESSGETMALPAYVRFTLDSYVIRPSEQVKIDRIVEYLRALPDSRLTLVGYADRNTGNPRYNYNLSRKRVEVVRAALVKQGIASNRFDIQWRGDREQPFAENDWNRVVIVIEQK